MNQNPTVKYNDFRPETRSLFAALIAAGFTIRAVDNGGGKEAFESLESGVSNACACDECHVFVTAPDGKRLTLYLVLGNSPGELLADYTVHPELEKVASAESDKWFDTPQRTTDKPY